MTKFPTILVVKPGQKKPIKYEDKIVYSEVFEFLNRYQETFAMEKPAQDEEDAAKRPWLSESFPEMHALSAPDVCYNADSVCVITVTKPGADGKVPSDLNNVIQVSSTFSSSPLSPPLSISLSTSPCLVVAGRALFGTPDLQ